MKVEKKKPKKKKKLSPEEQKHLRVKREHAKLIKNSLKFMGFAQILSAADKEFVFDGAKSDFDDLFVYENVIVLAEYTTSQESGVSDHIKQKKIVYDKILNSPKDFAEFLFKTFPDVEVAIGGGYSVHQIRIVICYCSLNTVKGEIKELIPNVKYFDYNVARYFDVLAKTIKLSARHEFLDFLGLSIKDVGTGVLSSSESSVQFSGSILPESHSNFGVDFKVVSFYMNPASLLERAYVLRKYGWRDGGAVYQRMIVRQKIASIRRYLRDRKRVFINNIIVTLPNDTKLIDKY